MKGSDFIKRFKIIFVCFLVLIISSLSVFSAFASESSVSGKTDQNSYCFTPFNLSFRGDLNSIYDTTNSNLTFNVPLPDMYYELSDSDSYYVDFSMRYFLDSVDPLYLVAECEFYESSPSFIGYRFFGDFDSYNDYSFSNTPYFLFQNCYLGSDSKIDDGINDGVSFAVFDYSGESPSLYNSRVRGQFYLPGFQSSYSFEYEYGSYLSYYAALVNSNIPWSDFYDYYSSHSSVDEFLAKIEVAKTWDFLHLTDQQVAQLSQMFDWVGYIYGLFGCYCSDFYSVSGPTFDCLVYCSLVDNSDLLSYYRFNVEQSTYSGLTGFERVTRFLGSAVSGFLNLEIMPGFSFSGFFIVFISFGLVLWWLKVFAGG